MAVQLVLRACPTEWCASFPLLLGARASQLGITLHRGDPAQSGSQSIFDRNDFVRSSSGLEKKMSGGPVSTITSLSVIVDTIGGFAGKTHFMSDQHASHAFGRDRPDDSENLSDHLGVERGGHFVE